MPLRLRALAFSACSMLIALAVTIAISAQEGDRAKTEALARRVNERVRALQREADRLAAQSRTLLGQLRRLEIERDLQIERVKEAEAEVDAARASLKQTTERMNALERERLAQLPDLRARLVAIYKQGRGGYARMLLNVHDLREFGRATRSIESLAHTSHVRVTNYRRTIEALRKERTAIEQKTTELQARQAEARQAHAAAERAVAARNTLIAEIDRRRDLNAQLAGELLVAQQKVNEAVTSLAMGRPVERVSVPIAAFRGALEWPVPGRVLARFGQPSSRFGGAGVRNGIEITAAEDTPVHAVHAGTVGYADTFAGYGTLVIVDHGANYYSLYGYLSSATVKRGEEVDAGDELGRVGSAPAGQPALYFELRVEGRSVDPIQWLKKRP